jgi:hypothetical protein
MLHHITKLLRLDDPVDAIPVHAGSGLFGVLVVAFCRPDCNAFGGSFTGFTSIAHFCEDDYRMGQQLAAQVWGVLTIIAWAGSISVLVWGVPALSECTMALEDGYLEQVAGILFKMALAAPSEEQEPAIINLTNAVKQSELATNILNRHGWAGNKFEKPEYCEPTHLLQICRNIKSEQNAKVKTALEITHWRSCTAYANFLRRCSLHKCCTFRLRILPAAELTGLGTTDIEGGWILAKVKRLIQSVDKEAVSAERNTSKCLQQEVRQLNALVHGQEALLRSLTRHPQRMPQILDVEGGMLQESDSSISSLRDRCEEKSVEKNVERPSDRGQSTSSENARIQPYRREYRLQRSFTSSGGRSSASTQSDPNTAVTPHSGNDSTPPPSTLGRMQATRQRHSATASRGPMPREIETFNMVAQQLSEVLERQQQLLTTFQNSSPQPLGLAAAAGAPPQPPTGTAVPSDHEASPQPVMAVL